MQAVNMLKQYCELNGWSYNEMNAEECRLLESTSGFAIYKFNQTMDDLKATVTKGCKSLFGEQRHG